ncbi:MAG TPA: thiamine phosphate synthase [Beijerinckiaceae bacterium]|nr:thiamine phosphate synthase [Beijerinckiaceae bacterium]
MAAPELLLITPDIAAPDGYRDLLDTALAAAPFAAVILRAAGGDDGLLRAAKALAPIIRKRDAAVLLDHPADMRVVARSGADGAHVAFGAPALAEAADLLKPNRMVGVGGLRSKHDAMEAGEADVDYVLFGEPRPDGSLPEPERVIERAQWWAEIFNLPCVVYARDLASIPDLAETGAEFLALGPWVFEAGDPAATVREARRLASMKM